MKKLSCFMLVLSAIAFLSISAVRPVNKHTRKTSYSLYVANGTAWDGIIKTTGAAYLTDTFGTSGYYYIGSVNTGYITVTLTSFASGSHLYQFTGAAPQTTSSGSVTWTNVPVTGTLTASVY